MTTEQDRVGAATDPLGADAVSEGQTQLDQVQNGTAPALVETETAPAPVTRGEMDQVLSQNRSLESQVRGLQSAVDRTLQAVTTLSSNNRSAQMEQELESVPEEMRPYLQALQESNERRFAALESSTTTAVAPPAVAGPSTEQRAFAQGLGVDPSDSRIDYAALSGPGSQMEQVKAFTDSVYAIKPGFGQPATPQQTPATSQASPVPISGAPAQTAQASSKEDVLNAYLSDQLTAEEADKRLTALGTSLERLEV